MVRLHHRVPGRRQDLHGPGPHRGEAVPVPGPGAAVVGLLVGILPGVEPEHGREARALHVVVGERHVHLEAQPVGTGDGHPLPTGRGDHRVVIHVLRQLGALAGGPVQEPGVGHQGRGLPGEHDVVQVVVEDGGDPLEDVGGRLEDALRLAGADGDPVHEGPGRLLLGVLEVPGPGQVHVLPVGGDPHHRHARGVGGGEE
jgi:hypothetical protein